MEKHSTVFLTIDYFKMSLELADDGNNCAAERIAHRDSQDGSCRMNDDLFFED